MPDLTSTGRLTSGSPVMSTMWGDWPDWLREVDFYVPERLGSPRDIVRLFRMARQHRQVILLGAVSLRHRYRDLVLAAMIRTIPRRRRPQVLITDATWEPRSRALGRLTRLEPERFGAPVRLMVKLVDGPHVRYGVLSEDELASFPGLWGVPADRVRFTPFPSIIGAHRQPTTGSHLFCGGDSLRDYDTLERAVEGLEVPVVVASRWRPRGLGSPIQAGFLPSDEYEQRLASARAVVVPLQRSTRSAGQQTYLNAMLLRKPTIVSDTTGVRSYIEDGVTGVLVPPADPAALRAAIDHVLDPANAEHYRAMGDRAHRAVVERHLPDHYWGPILLEAVGS